mmetsp:Transcript_1807/g.5637  ORF Transcript_1807/g.5637 Transcript_1807/m.5637 type:complete len:123 (+) Transcript_1807:1377-1745(+)
MTPRPALGDGRVALDLIVAAEVRVDMPTPAERTPRPCTTRGIQKRTTSSTSSTGQPRSWRILSKTRHVSLTASSRKLCFAVLNVHANDARSCGEAQCKNSVHWRLLRRRARCRQQQQQQQQQ